MGRLDLMADGGGTAATALVYFALLASSDEAAARLSDVVGAPFRRADGGPDWALFRAHAQRGMLELQTVEERLEGSVYSLVAVDDEGADDDLDAYLRAIARDAGATRTWSHEEFGDAQGERAPDLE